MDGVEKEASKNSSIVRAFVTAVTILPRPHLTEVEGINGNNMGESQNVAYLERHYLNRGMNSVSQLYGLRL
jgi:hypothetical protein